MAIAETAPVSAAIVGVAIRQLIVVGTDDNPESVAALRFAATEAVSRSGDVLAVHVWHWPSTWGQPGVWPKDEHVGTQILTPLQQSVAEVLAERANAGEPIVGIRTDVIQGIAAAALRDASRGAAMLVLGAGCHNRFLGSVSMASSPHPSCPVVVAPAAGTQE